MKKCFVQSFIIILLLFISNTAGADKPPSSIRIEIPDYTVTTVENLDYVEIPGGEILSEEEGRPLVPYHVISIDYPKGFRVQDVILKEKAGLRRESGLRLPVVVLNPPPLPIVEMIKGWYPEKEYDWQVWENPDDSTTLVINMYPFYYYPDTTEIKFYRNYEFEISYISTKVSITSLNLNKATYKPGEKIVIDIRLNNIGVAQDVVANFFIRQYGSDKYIDGLPLKSLTHLTGDASYNTEWESGDTKPGYYYLEATLTDMEGNLLSRRTESFAVQVTEQESEDVEKSATSIYLLFGIASLVFTLFILFLIRAFLIGVRKKK